MGNNMKPRRQNKPVYFLTLPQCNKKDSSKKKKWAATELKKHDTNINAITGGSI